VPVAGGALLVGGADQEDGETALPAELFDERSGRWYQLPCAPPGGAGRNGAAGCT
jgi:hypothetical protein